MICRNFKLFSQKRINIFGHVASLADRVDHLRQLRALQDETHGFTGFVPLPYQPENNDIPVQTPPSVALDALRILAVSRSASTTPKAFGAGASGVELRRGRSHGTIHLP